MFLDLVAHKSYADAAVLHAIQQCDAASADMEIRTLLHHILVSNRFWLLTILGEPFVADVEMRVPDSIDELVLAYQATHEREMSWLVTATDADLSQTLEHPLIPGKRCSVAQALLQVCLHSHGHRAQIAKMLRRLGGRPPAIDFILWLKDRHAPDFRVAGRARQR